jgi:hypothetical protein
MIVEGNGYHLTVSDDGLLAELQSPTGETWLQLRPLAAVDALGAPDETLAVETPRQVSPGIVEVRRRSSVWDEAAVRLCSVEDGLEVRAWVRGRGDLDTVRLLAGRSLIPGHPNGLLPSGTRLTTLFTPNPEDPERIIRPAAEPAVIGVVGDSEPGRGRWFFTPAPLYLVLGHVGISVLDPVERLRFPEFRWEPADRAFSLAFDYEGHTRVDGVFEAPALLLTPGVEDPYRGLRAHRDSLVARGAAPKPTSRRTPAWWSDPVFCGWGAQVARADASGRRADELATQAEYDAYLETLEREGIVPGTVTIDDKWQSTYGRNEPDTDKWPDLAGWIAARHDRGQRTLLWYKAWDPEGLAAELCVRNVGGAPLGIDPSNPAARAELASIVVGMLGPDGLDADGLKIDFTARTPSGYAACSTGAWGIALLHELLQVVYDAAKQAKPDALIVTQTPHPAFVDVTDMIRLNDMARLGDGSAPGSVVPQMRHRAEVARAACSELLIDTDDWPVPSLATWREYLGVKPSLGVPALYYADFLDGSGVRLGAEDYEALRKVFRYGRSQEREL